MTIQERVKNTPQGDWPVADRELSGPGKFFAMYGGEHIAATEFVIGATLAQYGCTAKDILLGLLIGNLIATLLFRFLCAPIAVRTRLTLYTFLGKVLGSGGQKLYNFVFGVGYAAIGALGIGVSATAIRQIFNVPIQQEWYPTDIRYVIIVIIIGAIVVLVAANGFEGVSKFASLCVPWMICLFILGILCVLPQLSQEVGFEVNSIKDVYTLLDQYIWTTEAAEASGNSLSMPHVAAFAVVCNLALHLGLNDMSVFRYAKKENYGFISAMGMFVGHYFAWVSAAIMGATASILLNTDLGLLDSGEVSYTVIGYIGLVGVVIAGWTTANPIIYRVALSFNTLFPKLTYKKITYIMGTIIVILACFPGMQNASTVINYSGLLVVGMGAICCVEYYLFPKMGMTRYWNLYKKKNVNWAGVIAWICGIVFFAAMLITNAIQENFWFIFVYIICGVVYFILASAMGARNKYPEEEAEELEYEKELQDYVNEQVGDAPKPEVSGLEKVLKYARFAILAIILIVGIVYWTGSMGTAAMKTSEGILTLIYFIVTIGAFAYTSLKNRSSKTAEA